jgi:predicted metal-dependent phosphoesterase TrpH
MVPPGLRLDLHNHTSFSPDGLMSPADLLHAARANGLACLAVTDHNTIEGALAAVALAEADPTLPGVIPGIEVSSAHGDVIGLYLREAIPPRLPVSETIALIREQGGLVYLPHPFGVMRRGTIASQVRDEAADQADIIEVLNGRSLSPLAVRNAQGLARIHAKPGGAGSDAHGRAEVARAYVVIDENPTRENLVALVATGTVRGGLHWHEYLLNWALQPMSGVTRFRRTYGRALLSRR